MKKLLIISAAVLSVCSCGITNTANTNTKGSLYPKMYEEKPVTLLILPPINNSANVDAKEYMYTSISRPLIEQGYYVISPAISMDILKAESAYDAENFLVGSLVKFKKFFGADAVVFTQIDSWAKVGTCINTNIRIFIRSTSSGETIFDRQCNLVLDMNVDYFNSSQTGLLGSVLNLATAAIKTAATDHVQAARVANSYILKDMPFGGYVPDNELDKTFAAGEPNITATVKW